MFAGKKSAQIREILISESAWEEMTCLFAPSLEGSEYDYFFFVTNTTLLSEKVVIYYEKRGNAENGTVAKLAMRQPFV
ncbi:TPA: hypothetical protein JIE88_003827, partial [Acinetobacter baumannii]|nr:hypothetical protein [Acinetobacter baumannii]